MYGLHVHACPNRECVLFDDPVERFFRTTDQAPQCEGCLSPMRAVLQPFSVVFTGPITQRYKDRDKAGYHGPDGHVVWERDPITKKPTPVHVETFADQKAYCKRNGLMNPKDAGNNCEVRPDGMTVANPIGMPGCEV